MKGRYFKKNQSSLQRQIIAGGLAATFVFGMVGSGFAGATEEKLTYNDSNTLGTNLKIDNFNSFGE